MELSGLPGQGVIVSCGARERVDGWFNLDIDMEVHVGGRRPYRVNAVYPVPVGATIGQGVTLPIRVDPEDPLSVAIDWDSAQRVPARAEIPPA